MFCPNCGTSLSDGYKFCTECGTRLPESRGVNTPNAKKQPIFDTRIHSHKSSKIYRVPLPNEQKASKDDFSLWRFIWGSGESSISKCIWVIILGTIVAGVGYLLLDYSNVIDPQHGEVEYRWMVFMVGYVIHVLGMGSVTRYVIILLSKVKSGVYESSNYGKRIKAYFVCLIFFVGWIMGKSCIRSWLEIDKPSFSVWEWIILCAVLKTAWRSIMGVNPKSGSKSASRKRLGYVLWTILLLGGLLLPLILSVVNSSDSRQDRVLHSDKKVSVKEYFGKSVKAANFSTKQGQLYTEKFLDHCRNERFVDAERFVDKVDKDNADVQFYLGKMYEEGLRVEKSEQEAVNWYLKSAEQGNAQAQNNLGVMYYDGRGVSKDFALAVRWFYRSAAQENIDAQFHLGAMYFDGLGVNKNFYVAAEWFQKAANKGDRFAQFLLGDIHYFGGFGVLKNESEAFFWYRRAAEQGHCKAQFNLGWMYANGCGVAKDENEAVKWYRKAAEQGHAVAQNNLGDMYRTGRGVAEDYSEAVKWFRKAAEQGNADAQRSLGVMYANGEGVRGDVYEAVKWYRKAAEQGHAAAQCLLGWMYVHGCGVAKDEYEAVKWFRKAAEKGNSAAKEQLQRMGY